MRHQRIQSTYMYSMKFGTTAVCALLFIATCHGQNLRLSCLIGFSCAGPDQTCWIPDMICLTKPGYYCGFYPTNTLCTPGYICQSGYCRLLINNKNPTAPVTTYWPTATNTASRTVTNAMPYRPTSSSYRYSPTKPPHKSTAEEENGTGSGQSATAKSVIIVLVVAAAIAVLIIILCCCLRWRSRQIAMHNITTNVKTSPTLGCTANANKATGQPKTAVTYGQSDYLDTNIVCLPSNQVAPSVSSMCNTGQRTSGFSSHGYVVPTAANNSTNPPNIPPGVMEKGGAPPTVPSHYIPAHVAGGLPNVNNCVYTHWWNGPGYDPLAASTSDAPPDYNATVSAGKPPVAMPAAMSVPV